MPLIVKPDNYIITYYCCHSQFSKRGNISLIPVNKNLSWHCNSYNMIVRTRHQQLLANCSYTPINIQCSGERIIPEVRSYWMYFNIKISWLLKNLQIRFGCLVTWHWGLYMGPIVRYKLKNLLNISVFFQAGIEWVLIEIFSGVASG